MSENKAAKGFGVWCVLELLGHVKVAGYVTEEELFGTKIGRIDIPADDEREAITQYFGGQSLYRLTPVTEDVARAFARRSPAPARARLRAGVARAKSAGCLRVRRARLRRGLVLMQEHDDVVAAEEAIVLARGGKKQAGTGVPAGTRSR